MVSSFFDHLRNYNCTAAGAKTHVAVLFDYIQNIDTFV
jgi:hypothetical protein